MACALQRHCSMCIVLKLGCFLFSPLLSLHRSCQRPLQRPEQRHILQEQRENPQGPHQHHLWLSNQGHQCDPAVCREGARVCHHQHPQLQAPVPIAEWQQLLQADPGELSARERWKMAPSDGVHGGAPVPVLQVAHGYRQQERHGNQHSCCRKPQLLKRRDRHLRGWQGFWQPGWPERVHEHHRDQWHLPLLLWKCWHPD